jgi:hypothetical protein
MFNILHFLLLKCKTHEQKETGEAIVAAWLRQAQPPPDTEQFDKLTVTLVEVSKRGFDRRNHPGHWAYRSVVSTGSTTPDTELFDSL